MLYTDNSYSGNWETYKIIKNDFASGSDSIHLIGWILVDIGLQLKSLWYRSMPPCDNDTMYKYFWISKAFGID